MSGRSDRSRAVEHTDPVAADVVVGSAAWWDVSCRFLLRIAPGRCGRDGEIRTPGLLLPDLKERNIGEIRLVPDRVESYR
jgi:hypothetical protein